VSDNPTLNGPTQPAHDKLEAVSYFDLATTFRVGDNYNFRLGVNNIFDKIPPLVGSGSGEPCQPPCNGNVYAQVYDALGRYIYAGVTLDF
jgi:iron complex outermembrane recepter protein